MSPTGERRYPGPEPGGAAGFTLIELLVVLFVVAAVALLALPRSSRSIDDARLKAGVRMLAADLRWLRQQAIAVQQETSLTLDVAGGRYRRSTDAAPRALPADLRLHYAPALATAGLPVIRFHPDGTSSGGRIDLLGGGRAFHIAVSWPFGRVQVRE